MACYGYSFTFYLLYQGNVEESGKKVRKHPEGPETGRADRAVFLSFLCL
jgi:hypothetical protein